MHAYNSIILRQGFSVRQGGIFHAYLTDCPDFEQYTPSNKNLQNSDTLKTENQKTNQIIEFPDMQFEIYPNPASKTISISYSLPQSSAVTLEIYDIYGQKLKEIENTTKNIGDYQYYINLSFLQSGIYFCVLKTQFGVVSKKIVKI